MTNEEFETKMETYELDDEYQEFIMNNFDPTERLIYNSNSLIDAVESEYLLPEFKASLVKNND